MPTWQPDYSFPQLYPPGCWYQHLLFSRLFWPPWATYCLRCLLPSGTRGIAACCQEVLPMGMAPCLPQVLPSIHISNISPGDSHCPGMTFPGFTAHGQPRVTHPVALAPAVLSWCPQTLAWELPWLLSPPLITMDFFLSLHQRFQLQECLTHHVPRLPQEQRETLSAGSLHFILYSSTPLGTAPLVLNLMP